MGKRNPNGYGCVTKLKGNRARPYVVKVTVHDLDGDVKQVPIGYTVTRSEGNDMLAEYRKCPWDVNRETVTLVDLYNKWIELKVPKLGKGSSAKLKSAFKHCHKYYGWKYRTIKSFNMQDTIDNCGHGYSTQAAIKNLWGHLDRFAFELDVVSKMYSQVICVSAIQSSETTRVPFTKEQINLLWGIKDEPWVDTVLIYIYTGFRLNELLDLKSEQVNVQDKYFIGGSKTTAGKGRIIPIHPKIQPFVDKWLAYGHEYLLHNPVTGRKVSATAYYNFWQSVMDKICIGTDRVPHEARHTFRTLLGNTNADQKCIDMLLGHKSLDVGNRVYNHKTIEQLRNAVHDID